MSTRPAPQATPTRSSGRSADRLPSLLRQPSDGPLGRLSPFTRLGARRPRPTSAPSRPSPTRKPRPILRFLCRRRAATWIDYGLLTAGVLFLLVVTAAIVGSQTNFFLQRAVKGTGEEAPPPPPPATLSWSGPTTGYDITGGVSPGPSQSVFLTNDGGTNANAAGVFLAGPDASRFAIVLNTCTGALAPAASCEVRIALAATLNGSFSAALAVPGAANHPLFGTASGF